MMNILIVGIYDGEHAQNVYAYNTQIRRLYNLKIDELVALVHMDIEEIADLYPGYDLYIIVDNAEAEVYAKEEIRQ